MYHLPVVLYIEGEKGDTSLVSDKMGDIRTDGRYISPMGDKMGDKVLHERNIQP